jgi:hypothetical protein
MTLDPYLGIEVWCDNNQDSVYQSVARLTVTVRELQLTPFWWIHTILQSSDLGHLCLATKEAKLSINCVPRLVVENRAPRS